MILSRLVRLLRINEFMNKYGITFAHIIMDERLSTTLYGNNSHVGEKIHLLELKNLLELNMICNSFRSKL